MQLETTATHSHPENQAGDFSLSLGQENVENNDIEESFDKCSDCDNKGPNLWLCLYPDCQYIGCAGKIDHSTLHNTNYPAHSAQINLSSNRIWCYSCQNEIQTKNTTWSSTIPESLYNKSSGDDCDTSEYKENAARMQRLMIIRKHMIECKQPDRKKTESVDSTMERYQDSAESSDAEDSREFSSKPRGLVGLQNIGNTCYMNSALQALSNIPQLSEYFLNCSNIITYIIGDHKKEFIKQSLSLSYLKLIREMWSTEPKNSVVPHAILTGIRIAHPMFRGYHQHDTQEFLRCFMDQLHEELKENTEDDRESPKLKILCEHSSDEEETEMDGAGSSQSDGEYETCDSGVSEQSSLSDEGERGMKRRYSRTSQPEKLRTIFSNRSIKKSAVDISHSQSQKSIQSSPTKRTKKQIKTKSIISDIFDGKLLSSVQCLTCDRISTRIETFQDLSLPIPSRDHIDMLHQGSLPPQKISNSCSDAYVTNQSSWLSWILQWMRSWFWGPIVSLHDCLSAFFSADELKGDNMYSCEKCNKLRNGTKFSEVLELPEILCIHLKRFRHELMFSSKIASYVSFPLQGLDMRPYVHKECVSKVTTYDLVSVICHHGTAGGGHYVCYALNPIINQWFEFDDQRVTRVSPETVKNCEAYVLFYRKVSPDMLQIRDKIMELMEMSSRDPVDLKFYVSRQWINRLNTFAEPGPIDNSDFLCPHGGVNPEKTHVIEPLTMLIPQKVWEYFYEIFGGGPACTHLYECSICEEKYENLQNRRQYELDSYHQLNVYNIDNPTSIYALSMAWFRQWQNFIKGKELQPPGPIDNNSIVVNKGGQAVLKVGSDYIPVPEEVWQFFESTYGGGPEMMLPSGQRVVPTSQSNISVHSAASSSNSESNSNIDYLEKLLSVTKQKNTDATSSQDSAIDSFVSNITTSNESHPTLKTVK